MYKLGDEVIIKSWDELCAEFPINSDGDIQLPNNMLFLEEMKNFCNQKCHIRGTQSYNDIIYYILAEDDKHLYNFTIDMFTDSNMNIYIKYFTNDIPKLEKINQGDWIDLCAAEDIDLIKDEFRLIPLGVAMQLPKGYEAHLVPRSSTFKKYGIIQTNHMGIIDNSYCGDNDEWKFPAYATRNTIIHKGDRICQFRIMKNQPVVNFVTVEHLNPDNRGGFGSTD